MKSLAESAATECVSAKFTFIVSDTKAFNNEVVVLARGMGLVGAIRRSLLLFSPITGQES